VKFLFMRAIIPYRSDADKATRTLRA
jgi:hypothetical protein